MISPMDPMFYELIFLFCWSKGVVDISYFYFPHHFGKKRHLTVLETARGIIAFPNPATLVSGFRAEYVVAAESHSTFALDTRSQGRVVEQKTGWWFERFFMFTPTWGNDPIWRAYFSKGWFNHQLEKLGFLVVGFGGVIDNHIYPTSREQKKRVVIHLKNGGLKEDFLFPFWDAANLAGAMLVSGRVLYTRCFFIFTPFQMMEGSPPKWFWTTRYWGIQSC